MVVHGIVVLIMIVALMVKHGPRIIQRLRQMVAAYVRARRERKMRLRLLIAKSAAGVPDSPDETGDPVPLGHDL